MIEWNPSPAYRVHFSTRRGGVSEQAFASLNLGARTGDDPTNVRENRSRLCAEVGVEPGSATMTWQQHGADVVRADARGLEPRTRYERADGLWSDVRGEAVVQLTADCLPVVVARVDGSAPAVAALHAGWRGLLAGVVGAGVAALGGGETAAAVGPGIGPCCYEVGEEVAAAFRAAFGAGVVRGRKLDLWTSAERALRAAGCSTVERVDLCTACHPELFFSHRRDHGRTGRQGVIACVA